ncbi:MAG TPA: lactate utilization protein B [Candidatus Acidoferrales bacterium]|nr:lactate utilization protein B [Candidatus Acidoferrales bacterium]
MAEVFDRRAVSRAFAHPQGTAALATTMRQTSAASDVARAQVPWRELRDAAREIKAYSLANLDRLLERFEAEYTKRGGTVLWASSAAQAGDLVIEICRRHNATSVVKGKSMLSEEIDLNERLAAAGIHSVETDLGEFIVQLAGQKPSHIVGPALHLSRADVGELFSRKLGMPRTDDPQALMAAARVRLRRRYLEAGVGVTGVNFAVAETGTIVVVENEGNGGLSASVPKVHVALMGIEKVIPRLADLPTFLRLLARAATSQKITTYTHYFLGAEPGKTMYCVLVDAKRTELLADPKTRASLSCIRCGACLNVCPVYRRAGGWAYGAAYSGPIGAAIDPVLVGMDRASELPFVSTLCGACQDTCPVGIDLAHQLVYLRNVANQKRVRPNSDARMLALWAKAMHDLTAYRRGVRWLRRAAALGRTLGIYPGALGVWSKQRAVPWPARQSFKEWWESR